MISHSTQLLDFLVIATADWDNPLWTNKQHLSSRLGERGHRVLYVESLGLRRPGLSSRDLGRMWRRLRRANRLRKVAPSIWVLSPLVVPAHGLPLVTHLNRCILKLTVGSALRRIGMTAPVLWTYNPLVLDILGGLRRSGVVYHCVDELTGSPGMPSDVLEQADRDLCRQADLVIVSSPTLAEGRSDIARRIEYLPNVADFQNFVRATDPATPIARDLTGIAPPRFGFIGAISNYKLDLELLEKVFRARPEWSLVMVGPLGGGDPNTRVDALQALPNVHFLGTRPHEDLPTYLKGFDVCLLPNRLNLYTRSMFPLKFFEYLASGRPVVMTPLPSLADYADLAYVADAGNEESFVRCAELALAEAESDPVRAERVAVARRHDWDAQVRRLLALVREVLSPEPREAVPSGAGQRGLP